MPDVSIGRFRGGFCVYWTGPDGKRKRYGLEARTRKEAEVEAPDVYRRVTQAHKTGVATVKDIWEAYVQDLGDKPTAKTMGWTGKAVLAHFGNLTPEQITRGTCRQYAKSREDEGRTVGTIHTELGHLKSALIWGRKTKMTKEVVDIWRPSKPETDFRILNRGEASALIDGAHDPHIRLAIVCLLGLACRVGALLDLTWDRIDFEQNSINLRLSDSVTRKGRAIVPMNAMVRAALFHARESALSDYVIEYAGGPVKSIRVGFHAAVGRARIGHVRIHDIRHTAAVTMLSSGVPIEKVSQYLGHSNMAMTFKVYARYLPNHMQDAADVLDFSSLSKRKNK